jgi:hypothetical protein
MTPTDIRPRCERHIAVIRAAVAAIDRIRKRHGGRRP